MSTNLLQKRVELFKDAVRLEKIPQRVPYLSNFNTWIEIDSPYRLTEALSDYEKAFEIYCRFQEEYKFDGYKSIGGFANDISVADPLGGEVFRKVYDDDKAVQISDIELCSHEELDELAKDPWKFMWTKILPEKFSELKKPHAEEKLLESMKRFHKGQNAFAKLSAIFKDEYEVPPHIWSRPVFYAPPDLFLNYFRGIKGMSVDMRKDPEKFKEACDSFAREFIDKRLFGSNNDEAGTDDSALFDATISLLAHTILSYKQFEKFSWPYLKRIIDYVVEKDKLLFIYGEGDIHRFIDFFQEIPKGHAAILSENDNIFELREKLPNVCLVGGMPVALLGRASKQECTDYAKELIDRLGRDGGFIFSQDKMVAYANDCKAENLKAVSEVVLSYGINH